MSLLSLVAVAGVPLVLAQGGADILSFIDPLIGTINGGHVFAGATLPFGMAKAVADVNGNDFQGGFALDYDPQASVTGFSHMHDSGTGGSPSLGNFPLFPQSFCPNDDVQNCVFDKVLRATPFINTSVKATPGYFSVKLATEITGEMTVTNHTALYRFTFPSQNSSKETLSPLILADLTDLPESRSSGSVEVDDATGRIKGSAVFSPSFGIGNYNLHLCADFSGAAVRDTGTFLGGRVGTDPKKISVEADGTNTKLPAGAWTSFHAPNAADTCMLARVGVSFISQDQACANAEKEIPDFDFAAVKSAAEAAWVDQLSPIEIKPGEGVPESLQKVFWSGVYRSNISPQDYTGENPLWDSTEPYYDSYYCIWDSFRGVYTLITIVDPHSQILMMRSLIDIYRHEGWLPDCRMSLCKGYTQGGSNADVLLAEFYLKLHTVAQDVDWPTAYAAVGYTRSSCRTTWRPSSPCSEEQTNSLPIPLRRAPAKSAERAHFYIPSQFNETHVGIPGNDDSGAMGSFVAFAMLGLFPNAGQDVYLITPPFVEEWSITNKITGKVATVRNVNFDAGYKNIYIQEAKLNNVAYTRNWIGHSFFLEGGVLELVLGDKESEWGTKEEDLPPSLSTTGKSGSAGM